jgi:hypothetical protein
MKWQTIHDVNPERLHRIRIRPAQTVTDQQDPDPYQHHCSESECYLSCLYDGRFDKLWYLSSSFG